MVEGIDGIVQVLEIGIRTTKLRLAKWDSIQKIPNSKMITEIVDNWSQNFGSEPSFGINLILKIDGISSEKTAKICESLREMPKSINSLHDEGLIGLDRLEHNARVINIRVFSNNINFYEKGCEQLNKQTWEKTGKSIN
jgi:MscS family membrane protein